MTAPEVGGKIGWHAHLVAGACGCLDAEGATGLLSDGDLRHAVTLASRHSMRRTRRDVSSSAGSARHSRASCLRLVHTPLTPCLQSTHTLTGTVRDVDSYPPCVPLRPARFGMVATESSYRVEASRPCRPAPRWWSGCSRVGVGMGSWWPRPRRPGRSDQLLRRSGQYAARFTIGRVSG